MSVDLLNLNNTNQTVHFGENTSYYPSGRAATIASIWGYTSKRVDEWLDDANGTLPTVKFIGKLLQKPLWMVIETTAGLLSRCFEEKIDKEVYTQECTKWTQSLPA
ncbi:MAG: hypothetical protein JSR46_09880, partial [Verrucomicrobia bacterium]|nr:hypothetical protein [Verrucomicrobiota bacterium]